MLFLVLILCSLYVDVAPQENVGSLLMYEDQKEVLFEGEETGKYLNFLTLKRKIHDKVRTLKDVTICFRFNLISYRGESRGSMIMDGYTKNYVEFFQNKEAGTKRNASERMFFVLNPVPPGNGVFAMDTYPDLLDDVIPKDGVHWIWPIYKEEVNANKWHSICLGTDIQKRIMYIVHNGKTQDNVSQPEIWAEVARGLDTTFIEPYTSKHPWERNRKDPVKEWWEVWRESLYSGMLLFPNHEPFSGYFTDFQVFGSALSTNEMYGITTCKTFPKGDIYSWDVDDWEVFDKDLQNKEISAVQYRKVNISQVSLCKSVEKYTFFPDSYGFEGAINLCRRFGGKIVDVSTLDKVNAVGEFFGKEIKLNPKYDDSVRVTTYTMYTDKKEFNVWRHYETDELPKDTLVFNGGEPNGGMVENCAQLFIQPYVNDNTKFSPIFNDNTCSYPLPVACEDVGEIVIKFRGICKYSLIDTTYTMVEGDMNKKRFFVGNTGWKIFWDDTNSLWKLSSPKKKFMFGKHTEFETYPLGKNYWQIFNDTRCIYPNPDKILINMSPCNSSSFTCDDGTCIPMVGR